MTQEQVDEEPVEAADEEPVEAIEDFPPASRSKRYARGFGGDLALAYAMEHAPRIRLERLGKIPLPRRRDRRAGHAPTKAERERDLLAHVYDRARYVVPEGDGFAPLYSCEQIAANARKRGRYGMRSLTAGRVRAIVREKWPALGALRGD